MEGRQTKGKRKYEGGKMQVMDSVNMGMCEQLSGHHKRSSGDDVT